MWLRDLRNKIKWKKQRAKRGFSDYDTWSIKDWFTEIFPKILEEFINSKNGYPADDNEIQESFNKLPMQWVVEQIPRVNEIIKKYGEEFAFDDPNCQYILIIMRIEWLIERLDDFHPYWKQYRVPECIEFGSEEWDEWVRMFIENKDYEKQVEEILEFKKEAFELLERWFFSLWW